VPELDIEFIDSVEIPVGLGEPATTVVAPAIGNAIFAAVGARLRHLPIRPAALRKVLAGHSGAQWYPLDAAALRLPARSSNAVTVLATTPRIRIVVIGSSLATIAMWKHREQAASR
jgi:hypothetical protein